MFFRNTSLQNGKIHVLLFLVHQKLIKAMHICPQNVHYINKLTNDELFSWWKGGGFIFIRAESNIIHHICFSLPSCNLMSYKIVKKNDSQWKSGWIGQCRDHICNFIVIDRIGLLILSLHLTVFQRNHEKRLRIVIICLADMLLYSKSSTFLNLLW